MNDRLMKIFEIMSFYDKHRWSSEDNYSENNHNEDSHNLINFSRNDLDNDSKLLTHWLCYITDRQMPFKIVWDIGGFVFSDLVYNIKQNSMRMDEPLKLLDPGQDDSFVGKNDGRYFLISREQANDKISGDYKYKQYVRNGRVRFKSRFFPSDFFAILHTLVFLRDYNFRFSALIKEIYDKHKDEEDFIRRILFCLYLITYHNVKQHKSEDLDPKHFDANLESARKIKREIKKILADEEEFNSQYNKFTKTRIFEQKRAWCSLRDFLKSREFNKYFRKALEEEGLEKKDIDRFSSVKALAQLELPGDVWNNNPRFRECILKGSKYENSNKPLNMILREFYDKNYQIEDESEIKVYPEQFDVTFDFVPRMCEQRNCKICPINRLSTGSSDLEKICIDDESKFCTVALASCGYKSHCLGKSKCKLWSAIEQ